MRLLTQMRVRMGARLRSEVLEHAEVSLAAAGELKRPEEQARAQHTLIVHILDQVGRIASDHGGSLAVAAGVRGGGVSPLEAEVLSLRRELADAKVEVATLMGEKEELDHVARQLNKQLARTAAGAAAR